MIVKLTQIERQVAQWAIDAMNDLDPQGYADMGYGAGDVPRIEGGGLKVEHHEAREDFLYRLEIQAFQMKDSCDTSAELRDWRQWYRAAKRIADKVRVKV